MTFQLDDIEETEQTETCVGYRTNTFSWKWIGEALEHLRHIQNSECASQLQQSIVTQQIATHQAQDMASHSQDLYAYLGMAEEIANTPVGRGCVIGGGAKISYD